jgi:acetyl-CoA acyltransferase 1
MDQVLILRSFDSTQKHPDDVVITLAIRTPLTKGRKGGFKDTTVDGIIYKLLAQVVKKMNMDPALVEDICLGNVSLFRTACRCSL